MPDNYPLPLLHERGTEKAILSRQYDKASVAMDAAESVIADISLHPRDYVFISDTAYHEALVARAEVFAAIAKIKKHLVEHIDHFVAP